MAKYYYRNVVGFYVRKRIGGKDVSFGNYPSEQTAQRMVEELEKVDWDKEKYPAIRIQLRKEGYTL